MRLLLLSLPLLALSQSSLPSTTSLPPTLTALRTTLSPSPLPSTYTGPSTTLSGTPTTLILTLEPTTTFNASAANATPTNGTMADGQVLNPIGIDPTYGVLGALLILLHLPLLLLGPKLRLYTPLLLQSHLLSITTLILILHFGVEPNIELHPPDEELRGLYFLACIVAGAVGAGVAALWREYAEWACGAVAGFAIACWIEALHSGGVVQGEWRWLLFVGCAVGGFVLCTVRRLKMAVLVGSSAVVGASGVMLGIDCFTAAGLKEFYIANLGFTDLFPQLPAGPIPLTQSMTVELALLAALVLISLAIQLRVVPLLKARRERLAEERIREEREREEEKARRGLEEDYLRRERDEWEAKHGTGSSKGSPAVPERPSSQFELLGGTTYLPYSSYSPRTEDMGPETVNRKSGDYFAATPSPPMPAPALVPGRGGRERTQSLGPLPALDLGAGLLGGLASHTTKPSAARANSDTSSLAPPSPSPTPSPRPASTSTVDAVRDLQEKMALLDEIRSVRLEIGRLKSEASVGSVPEELAPARGKVGEVLTRARTLSANLDVQAPTPRAPSPGTGTGMGMGAEWQAYLRQRKLLVPGAVPPPQLVAVPVPTPAPAPRPPQAERVRTSPAVQEALEGRWKRESMMELGMLSVSGGGGRGGTGWDERRRASAYDLPYSATSPPLPGSPSLNPHGGLGLGLLSPQLGPQERRVVPSPRVPQGSGSPDSDVPPQQQQQQPRHPPRTMTTGQLDARHREALRGMQAPVRERLEREKEALRTAAAAGKSGTTGRTERSRPPGAGHGGKEEERRRRSTGDLDKLIEEAPRREREREGGGERERGEVPFPPAAKVSEREGRPPRAKRYPS